MPGGSIIFHLNSNSFMTILTCSYSYFDGDAPEETKVKTEVNSEEEEEGNLKAKCKSQR